MKQSTSALFIVLALLFLAGCADENGGSVINTPNPNTTVPSVLSPPADTTMWLEFGSTVYFTLSGKCRNFSHYDIQITYDSLFEHRVSFSKTDSVFYISFNASNFADLTKPVYWIRAQTVDSANNNSPFSSATRIYVNHLTVPRIITPPQDSVICPEGGNVTFVIGNPIEHLLRIHLAICRDTNFTSFGNTYLYKYNQPVQVPYRKFNFPDTLGGVYYAEVSTLDSLGHYSAYSPVRRFVITQCP